MAGVDEIEAAVYVNPDRFFFGLEQVDLFMMSSGPLVEYLIDEMDNLLSLIFLGLTLIRVDRVCNPLEGRCSTVERIKNQVVRMGFLLRFISLALLMLLY